MPKPPLRRYHHCVQVKVLDRLRGRTLTSLPTRRNYHPLGSCPSSVSTVVSPSNLGQQPRDRGAFYGWQRRQAPGFRSPTHRQALAALLIFTAVLAWSHHHSWEIKKTSSRRSCQWSQPSGTEHGTCSSVSGKAASFVPSFCHGTGMRISEGFAAPR